ncbi:MAG TPA: AAA family ATPase [Thermoplasmata archaeon]|nr:AAA family ATPase [Thermoplasmata archaeon]
MSPVENPDEPSEFGRAPAVVMFTDMVGYSELTQRDEAAALRLVNEHRRIVRPLLAEHAGREVKTIGDAFMVEFADPIAAVRCALAIQRKHAERNRNPSVQEMNIRIGLHSGPVIRQEGDLFGDTVNVASRIEPLAPPGGICLSAPVYEAALSSIEVVPVPVGPATLKNIHLPVAIYRIDLRPTRNVTLREGPWVDREEELAQLEAAFTAAATGGPRVVFISGEPGLGKTRLVEQLIRSSSRAEAEAVSGRATEEGVATPYALWVQAIEAIALVVPAEQLRGAAGEFAADLQRLVPGLPFSESGPPETPVTDPDHAKDRLFAGVARLFRELARERPLVLFFDDVQSADIGSLRLLESVARGLGGARLLLVVVHRPDPPAARSVLEEVRTALSGERNVASLRLGHLPLAAVRQLVLAHSKTKAIPDEFVRQIFERTGGNPYFVEEVVRSLREGGYLEHEPGRPMRSGSDTLPIPDTVRRLVRRRFEQVDEELAAFLRTVSVLGPDFPAEPLERLTGLGPGPLLDRLGAAVRAGMLTEGTGEQGTVHYTFADRLLWETIYGDTPVVRRNRDHLRAGDALEALRRAGARVGSAEIAHHFQRAQAIDRALPPTLRAAEEAGRLYAREEAVRHYRAALALLQARPDEPTRARVLEALADHLFRLGQLEAGLASRTEAIASYERQGALKEAGDLHRKIAHAMREDPVAARYHWEEALRLLEGGDESPELARLYSTIAGYRYEDGDAAGAEELYGRAVGVARRVNDPVTQVSTQIVLAGLRPIRDADRIFVDLEEALGIAEREKLEGLVPNVYMVLALAHLHVRGDGSAAGRALERALESARRSRDVHSERTVEGNLETYVAWREGQYERALRTAEAHLTYAAGDHRKLLPTALLVAADIALTRGEGERANRDLEEVAALLEGGGDWSERVHLRNVRGRAELLRGRLPRARVALGEAHDLAVRAGAPALMAALYAETLHAQVELAVRTGETGPAEAFLGELEGLNHEAAQLPIRAYAARARGLLLASRSAEPAGAIAAMEEAHALWERIGWGFELARTRTWLAGLYRRSGAQSRADELDHTAREFLDRIRDVTVGTGGSSVGSGGALPTGRTPPGPRPPPSP